MILPQFLSSKLVNNSRKACMVIHSNFHSSLNLRDLKNSSGALRVFPQELPLWNPAVGKRERWWKLEGSCLWFAINGPLIYVSTKWTTLYSPVNFFSLSCHNLYLLQNYLINVYFSRWHIFSYLSCHTLHELQNCQMNYFSRRQTVNFSVSQLVSFLIRCQEGIQSGCNFISEWRRAEVDTPLSESFHLFRHLFSFVSS